MHTKLKLAVLAAFSAVAFASVPANAAYSVYSDPDCGPKVESSAWFIDYSGTMQENSKSPKRSPIRTGQRARRRNTTSSSNTGRSCSRRTCS